MNWKRRSLLGKGFWREVYKTRWKGRKVAVQWVKEIYMNRMDISTRHVEECASIFPTHNQLNIVKLLDKLVFESEEPISVRRALELARDAARGVAQLHNAPGSPFAHTDLQMRQFLVDTDGTWKLNDFNRVKDAGLRLVDGVPSVEKSMFISEVAKGKWRKVYEIVTKEVRPSVEKMSDYSQQMQDLIVKGWDNDPKKRPAAKEIADEIERILATDRDSR
ncbi:unnamed protein product [Peronospora effusa]|nr:unnamed protein product [Peronospora effusa]